MKRFICTLFGLLAGMALLLPSLSWAKYPEKPITFICPYGAGGSTDIQARVLAGSLEKKLNQPIIVKNITGAGGLPGTQAAIDARPDGYTFGYIPLGPLVMQPHLRGLPSQVDQFAYVARIINAPYVLFVAANAPWNSFEAMMKDILANPKKYRYASSGAGTQPHIAMEDLFFQYGASVQHVAFHNDADAMQSMAGGHVQISTAPMSVVRQYGVKPLLVYDLKKISEIPEVLTSAQLGKSIVYTHWHVLTAPKGTPQEYIDAMSRAIAELSSDPDYLARLDKLCMKPTYMGPKDTEKMVREEYDHYGKIIARVIKK